MAETALLYTKQQQLFNALTVRNELDKGLF